MKREAERPVVPRGSEAFDQAFRRLKITIANITDAPYTPMSDAMRESYEANGQDDEDIERVQMALYREEANGRVMDIFMMHDPVLRFVYPGEAAEERLNADTSFTRFYNSLNTGVWPRLIASGTDDRNDVWWKERVRKLRFADVSGEHALEEEPGALRSDEEKARAQRERDEKARLDALGRVELDVPEMMRVVGGDIFNQLVGEVDTLLLPHPNTPEAVRDRELRRLYIEYLLTYDRSACINFLTLFARFLLATPDYVFDEEGRKTLKDGRNSRLIDVADHIRHRLTLQEEEEQHMKAEPAPVIVPVRDSHRRVTVEEAWDSRWQYANTLLLRVAQDRTLRYIFLQAAEAGAPLQVRMRVGGVSSVIELPFADRVRRLLKFYHSGTASLLLYVVGAHSANTALFQVPCDASTAFTRYPGGFLVHERYGDVSFIDAFANHYETAVCTWQRASKRLVGDESLQVLWTENVLARARQPDTDVTGGGGDGPRAERRKLLKRAIPKAAQAERDAIEAIAAEEKALVQASEATSPIDKANFPRLKKKHKAAISVASTLLEERREELAAMKLELAGLTSSRADTTVLPVTMGVEEPTRLTYKNKKWAFYIDPPLHGIYHYPDPGTRPLATQFFMHACKVVPVPTHRQQRLGNNVGVYHVIVALLCELPRAKPGLHLFCVHFRKFRLQEGKLVPADELIQLPAPLEKRPPDFRTTPTR